MGGRKEKHNSPTVAMDPKALSPLENNNETAVRSESSLLKGAPWLGGKD